MRRRLCADNWRVKRDRTPRDDYTMPRNALMLASTALAASCTVSCTGNSGGAAINRWICAATLAPSVGRCAAAADRLACKSFGGLAATRATSAAVGGGAGAT